MHTVELALLLAVTGAAPQEPVAVSVLDSFESEGALRAWTLRSVFASAATEHVTDGKQAARLTYPRWFSLLSEWPAAILDAGRGGFTVRDWSPYDALLFDLFNATDRQATLKLRLDDAKGTRYTRAWELPPKKPLTCEVPIAELARTLDTANVVHFDLFMTRPDADYVLYLDHVRLVAYPLRVDECRFLPDPFGGGKVGIQCRLSRTAHCEVLIGRRQMAQPGGGASYRQTTSRLRWTWDGVAAGEDKRPASPGHYAMTLLLHGLGTNFTAHHVGEFDLLPVGLRPELVAWCEPATRKVLLDARPAGDRKVARLGGAWGEPADPPVLRIEMARNEVEAAQLVCLTRERRMTLRFAIEGLSHTRSGAPFPMERSAVWQVGYVETKDPKIYAVDHVGWWADPLLPVEEMIAEPGECMPIWISLRSGADTEPGLYRGRLAIAADGRRFPSLPLVVRVHDVVLPGTTTVRTAFSTYDHMIARVYGHEELPRDLRRKFHEFIADHRINPDNIYRPSPPPIEDVEHFANRGQLNAFNLMYIRKSDKDHPYDEAHLQRIAAVLDPYVAELRRRKLAHLAYLYGFDEVRGDQWAALRRAFGFLKQRYPDIPLVTTARDHTFGIDSGLDDVVDIWVPLTAAYNLERAEAARKRGKQVWWYICIGPRHPYANWFIEYSALEPRLLWWMTFQHRVPGFLYYTMSRWPLQKEPLRLDGRNKTNWVAASYRTANGDGSLFCGGPDGPITTVRFENVRDGIEDHELLTLLTKRLGDGGKEARALCDRLIPSLTTFTRDPARFAEVRLRLLQRLAELSKEKPRQ